MDECLARCAEQTVFVWESSALQSVLILVMADLSHILHMHRLGL